MLTQILNQYRFFGFTGTRHPDTAASMYALVICGLLPKNRRNPAVGCATGIDQLVRSTIKCFVFKASSYKGNIKAALVQRSIDIVKYTQKNNGLLLAFPASECPKSLSPAKSPTLCFNGSGSGTWASVCLAIGNNCPVLIALPDIAPPLFFHKFGFKHITNNFWYYQPQQNQLFD